MRLFEVRNEMLLVFVRTPQRQAAWETMSCSEFAKRFIPEFPARPGTWRELQIALDYQNPIATVEDKVVFHSEGIEYMSQKVAHRSLLAMPLPDLGTDGIVLARMTGFNQDFFFKPIANVTTKVRFYMHEIGEERFGTIHGDGDLLDPSMDMLDLFKLLAKNGSRTMQMNGQNAIWLADSQTMVVDGGGLR